MFFLKTEVRYEYMKELNDKVFIDPLFYSAYHYVRKALINLEPNNEMLNNIETPKEYFSLDLKIKPSQLLKNVPTDSYLTDNEKIEKVEVSEFFFQLLEIFPFYTNYRMYLDPDSHIPEFEIASRGLKKRESIRKEKSLTQVINNIKNREYQRGEELTADTLNINHLFIYLGLGEDYFPTVTSFQVNTVDEYLGKLSTIISDISTLMNKFTPNKTALREMLINTGNESRASFFNGLEPITQNFEEYMHIAVRQNSFIQEPMVYPIAIEKREVNPDDYYEDIKILDYLSTENVPILDKITDTDELVEVIYLQQSLDELLLRNGYNVNLINTRHESIYINYRKISKHSKISRRGKNAIKKLYLLYEEELVS